MVNGAEKDIISANAVSFELSALSFLPISNITPPQTNISAAILLHTARASVLRPFSLFNC